MKIIITLLLIALSCNGSYAQKIKENGIDKFTKKQLVQTSFEKIVSDKSVLGSTGGRFMKDIWVSFRLENDTQYLRLKWCTNSVIALDDNADVILLDKDGNTYTFKNTGFTVSGKGEGTVGAMGSALQGLNIYLIGDCAALKGKEITDMRINTTDGYIDLNLNKKAINIVSATYEVFEKSINK